MYFVKRNVEEGEYLMHKHIHALNIVNTPKIVGYENVPGRVSKDASSLYAKNILNFLSLIIKKDEKLININWEDEIIKSVVLTHNGQLKLKEFM